jgi:hypothetical protein
VILRPHRCKENQCVMNHQQSTSISGKPHPENHKGEGNRPRRVAPLCLNFAGTGIRAPSALSPSALDLPHHCTILVPSSAASTPS